MNFWFKKMFGPKRGQILKDVPNLCQMIFCVETRYDTKVYFLTYIL